MKNFYIKALIFSIFFICALLMCAMIYMLRGAVRLDSVYIYQCALHLILTVILIIYFEKFTTLRRIIKASLLIPYALSVAICFAMFIFGANPRFLNDLLYNIVWLSAVPYFYIGGWIVSIEMVIVCFVATKLSTGKFPKIPSLVEIYNYLRGE